MFLRFRFIIVLLLTFFTSLTFAHDGATGIVKDRMDKFKESQLLLKLIIQEAKKENFAAVKDKAEQLAHWGKAMPDYFPEASNPKPSAAADRIWDNFADFTLRAQQFTAASINLAQTADTANKKVTLAAALAVAESCKACHSAYRN